MPGRITIGGMPASIIFFNSVKEDWKTLDAVWLCVKGNDENGYRSEFIKLVETATLLSR